MAFRLLTKDLLDLFTAMNEAVMNILSRFPICFNDASDF